MIRKTFLLAVMLVVGITAWAEVIGEGSCGYNANYSLTDDGVLTITGEGTTYHYSSTSQLPWFDHREEIKKVIVGEGITSLGSYFLAVLPNEELTISLPSTLHTLGSYAFLYTNVKELTLPASLGSIGTSCFWKSSIEKITFPEGLQYIEKDAFKECEALTEVVLPSTLKSLGNTAFSYCKALKTVTIKDGVQTLPYGIFMGCSELTSVKGGNYTAIGRYAFEYCSSLASIDLPKELKNIGSYAFEYCSALTELTLPEDLTALDKEALFNFTGLETLNIGKGLKEIHTPLFNGCKKLQHINVSEENTSFCALDDVLYSKDMSTLIAYPDAKTDEEFFVPEGVTTIGLKTDNDNPLIYPFYETPNLHRIVFANSVKHYGPYLFRDASNLEEIVLGTGTEDLGIGTFSSVTSSYSNLKRIICYATSVPTATSSTFQSNKNIQLFVPHSLYASYQADENWRKLAINFFNYTITCAAPDANGNYIRPSKPTSEGNEEILLIPVLSEGYVVESITVTDENGNNLAVTEGPGWWSFDMPEVNVIVSATFKYEGVPETPKDTYAYWAMADADKLEEGDYLIGADLELFYGQEDERGCRYAFCIPGTNTLDWIMKDVQPDEQVLVSTKNTFHITPAKDGYYFQLPNGNYLCPDDKAYNGASESKSPVALTITKSGDYVTITCGSHELKTYSKTYGFTPGYVDNLEQQQGLWTLFKRSGAEEYVADELGFIVDIDKESGEAKMISCVADGEWVMPTTTEIEGETYTYTAIASYALSGAEITSATLPTSLLSIETGAFMDCKSLATVIIGEATNGEKKLVPHNEKGAEVCLTIDSKAFAGCTSLNTFYCMLTTPPAVQTDTFEGVNVEKCQLIVPEESVELYKADAVWGKFLVSDPNGINAVVGIDGQSAVYDLAGRRMQTNRAGIYIVNGKKFVVK